jgi:hypothetical protein
MGDAKRIVVAPIPRADADRVIKTYHYSGKVVSNSQLHLGVFLDGVCLCAMQFGPSLDKRKVMGLVAGTGWNEFFELNRMAFGNALPRNSESRAIGFAIRLIRKHAPHIKWIVSFSDATQCGDGTIYRASGFVLTGIKRNTQIWRAPTGETFTRFSLTDQGSKAVQQKARSVVARLHGSHAVNGGGGASMKRYQDAGFRPLEGFQLRYVYFIDPDYRSRLTVPIIPFARIREVGASMYLGKHASSGVAGSQSPIGNDVRSDQLAQNGEC